MTGVRRALARRVRVPCPPGVEGCPFCGPDNAGGLRLRFYRDGDRVTTSFTPRGRHQGFEGLMAGVLISAIFDCLHYRVPVVHGVPAAVTARLEVQYRTPVRIGERLSFVARLAARRGRVFETRAAALLPGGRLAAESSAVYVEIPTGRLPRRRRAHAAVAARGARP